MRFRKVLGSCFIMAFFSACQQAEIVNQEGNDLRMSIVASIKNQSQSLKSRIAEDDQGNLSFRESDKIGVFVGGGDASGWTFQSSKWQPDEVVYWPDKTENQTFYAFYPYVTSSDFEEVTLPSLLEQTGEFSSVCERDFLVTTTEQSYGETGVVNLTEDNAFTHVLSLLKLTVAHDGDLQESVLKKISVGGAGIVSSGTYSFISNQLTFISGNNDDLLEVPMAHNLGEGENVFYFIVNPKEDVSDVTLTFEYATGDKTFVASAANFAKTAFLAGKMQSYTVHIKDRTISITGSDIQEWENGENIDNIEINGESKEQEA